MNLRKMKKVISAAVSSAMLLTSLFTGFAPAISASAASGPDLIVTGITWSPSSPVTGNAVTFSCTVKNQGDTATPAGVVVGAQFQVDGTEVSWSDTDSTSLGAGSSVILTANSGPSGLATWNATSGTHTILAWVDDVNRIAESNENNNQYTQSLTVNSSGSTYPVPGKVEAENYSAMYGIQTETCSEGTLDVGYVDAGDWMDYSINVATAGTYEVDFRIAANSPTGTIQLQENSNVLATLTPQNTGGWQNWSTQSVNVTLPAGVQTLRVYSTGNGWNLNYLNFQQNSSQPDLIVTGITTSPASPTAGDAVTFTATVENQGTAAGAPGTVAFSVDGTQVTTSSNNTTALAANSTTQMSGTTTWSATTGTHTILANVDCYNITTESNESNNTYTTSLTVSAQSQPDLIITGITTSPSSPNSGDAVTFTATVENQGTAAGAPGTVAFSVDGTQVTTSSNNTTALAANSTTQMSGTTTWSATTGTHTILANVDCYNITTESNESNNTYTTSLTVSAQSQPDLIITGITTSPASPTAGDAVTFTATVKNQGTAAGAPGTVAFSVDGTQVSTSSNNTTPLAANSTTQMSGTTTWSATGGTHTILANVDINNITTESNESNNTYTTSLTVSSGGGLPDLIVTSISWSPTSPVTGNATTFSCVVKNQGTGATPAGTIVGVQFQVDGTEMNWSDTDTTSLGAGNTVILTANNGPSGYATWTATTGTHTILAWVDDVNRITESNENNNQYSTSLTVSTSSLPDLSVTNVTYSPTSPAAGNAVTFTATIYNGGSANLPSGTGFGVDFYLDGTKLNISGSSTSPINTGGSITVNSNGTWTATSGNHNVYAIVDPSNVVTESNESNNQSSTYGITVSSGSDTYTRYEAENATIFGSGSLIPPGIEYGSEYSGGAAASNLDVYRCTFDALTYNFSNVSHVEFTVPRTATGIVEVKVGYVSSANDTIAVQANGDTPKAVTLNQSTGVSSVNVDMQTGNNTIYVSTTLNPRSPNGWVNIDYIDVNTATTPGTVEPPDTPYTPPKNPILTSIYTADPSARVFGNKLYIYASHDVDPAVGCNNMDKYHVFSTDNMVDWVDEGEVFNASEASWSTEPGFMWAPDCAYKNGTYYLYYPHPSDSDWNNSWEIGVATSSSPVKGFTDAGTISGAGGLIDPCVFIDDDGQAYLYAGGGGNCQGGKLNSNMTSLVNGTQAMTGLQNFHEATWVFKRNGIYYLMYADNTTPDNYMQYATSSSPLGPWTYKGEILGDTGCDTTHGSITEFQGNWYLFYHNDSVSGQDTLRSVCVDNLYFNADGTIQPVVQTTTSVAAVGAPDTPSPATTYSSTAATLSGGATLDTNTYSTTGSVVNLEATGSTATFTVAGGSGGRDNINLYYSLKDKIGKVDLIVNGKDYSYINTLSTGGKNFFTGHSNLTVPLNAGQNTIEIVGGNARVNLDYITVSQLND